MNNEKRSFIDKFQDFLMPIAAKLSEQRHLKAIMAGIMLTIPFTLLSAIFSIIANPPLTEGMLANGGWYVSLFTPWYNFATQYKDILQVPINMSTGILSLLVVVGVSYSLAKHYELNSFSTALTALVMFLLIAAPATAGYLPSVLEAVGGDITLATTTNVIDMSFLGSAGMFVAIIIGLTSTEVTRFCIKKNIVIKMPDVVPPAVSESFSTVIPLLINTAVFYGIAIFCNSVIGISLPLIITSILTPAIDNINTPIAIIGIITFGNFLWFFGIHGPALFSMLYIPIMFQTVGENTALVAQGLDPVFQPVMLTNFSNAYFGLVLLMVIISKSKQLKAVGKVSLIPGIFVISEPVIFGAPIMYNPILIVPHLLAPIVTMVLAYFGYVSGLLEPTYNLIFAQLPLGMNEFFGTMSFVNLAFYFAMILVQVVIWYPFMKIYDSQLVKKENEVEVVE